MLETIRIMLEDYIFLHYLFCKYFILAWWTGLPWSTGQR